MLVIINHWKEIVYGLSIGTDVDDIKWL